MLKDGTRIINEITVETKMENISHNFLFFVIFLQTHKTF